ncbi:hypothetical protein [Priestia aryabhattai]|uniref:hypothetical protein n=1 Tax=Priestia aryabhattai TaxID=412384 RepID=UPI002E1B809A|nr:hypothetical protein [Priestia aryabhattai]MED4257707.1 hypothetical protein [Priestia aryabhattai]
MTKEEKLKVLEKAVEMGADIEINFSKDDTTRESAESIAKEFAPLFDKPYYHENHDGFNWFKLEELEGDEQEAAFELTVFHD